MTSTNFPTLRTGAVAQYPSDRILRYRTNVSRFLDGSEQRFPQFSSPAIGWTIRLEALDEAELQRVRQFFSDQRGCDGSFAFFDPWTGAVYENCSFESDDFTFEGRSEGQHSTQIKIRVNRE